MARKPQQNCQNNHPMEGDNIIWRVRGGKKVRECRTCANARMRAARRAKKRNAIIEQQFQPQLVS